MPDAPSRGALPAAAQPAALSRGPRGPFFSFQGIADLNNLKWMAACAVWMGAGVAAAQTVSIAPPQNVLQLSANSTVEVQQDLLTHDAQHHPRRR